MKFFFLLGFLCCTSLFRSVVGEVERITIAWNTIRCNGMCIEHLANSLMAIQEISDLKIDETSGSAGMRWNPGAPFSFEPFRSASGAAGIRFNDIRLRVRGKISHDDVNFYLTSGTDLTRFILIAPARIEPERYIVTNNIASHPIPPGMQKFFLDTEELNQTVVISGPMFLPRNHRNVLIAEQIQIPKDS